MTSPALYSVNCVKFCPHKTNFSQPYATFFNKLNCKLYFFSDHNQEKYQNNVNIILVPFYKAVSARKVKFR